MKIIGNLEKILFDSLITVFVVFFALTFSVFSQSNNQLFPTPVTTNEINGKIKARDLGDSRLTTYYYAFNGEQGDVFINVVTSNFSGDIDVFSNDGAKTLTKIVIYADASENETGRVIYLRKSEKLLLRIEGRTPNDDDATFRIKFAGSFQAITDAKAAEELKLPEIKEDTSSGIRVNSVGTIIEVIPKPTPPPKEIPVRTEETEAKKEIVKEISIETEDETAVVAETAPESKKNVVKQISIESEDKTAIVAETSVEPKKSEEKETEIAANPETPKTEVKTEEPAKETTPTETEVKKAETEKSEEKTAEKFEVKTTENTAEKENAKTPKVKKAKKTKPAKAAEPDPLANIQLIVLFKDGTKLERPMSEILKVGVDKGILTVISKDGTIGRYSILDVAKMTIE